MAIEIRKLIKFSDLPASTAQENSDILSVEKADGSFYKTTRQAFLQALLDGKQDKLTFDTTPTAGSTKPVTSGGIKTALDGKANVSHTHTIADVTGLQSALDRKTDKPTWADLAIKANQGDFAVQYDFGDQFSDTWVDKSASKSYDFVWDYVHKRDVTLSDGETLTARPFLQMHYTTPYGVQFSHQRALTAVMYKTTSVLAKGTAYNFAMPDGRYLNFTCPEAVETGVWLGYNNGNIEVYNATGLNKSSEASASISATASGTSLGNTPSMPAGTYSFIFASNWGSNVVAGKAVSFTIPSALSFGDRICGLYGAPDYSPSNWKVYTVTDSGKTLSDPIAVTVSDDGAGTSLGTMPYSARVASLSFPLNSMQEVAYGWNRWKTSAARQWLNSEAGVGFWWEAQDAFDIRPNELSTKPGFLSGFPAEFLNAIKRVEVKTFANTVNDGSSSSPTEDSTYDRVFLPSMTEVYVIEQKTEGQPFEYWKRRLGISSPQGWYGEHAMPERICYGVDNHTSPQHVRFRSAYVSNACGTWCAYSTGGVYSGSASGALRSCPVVVL